MLSRKDRRVVCHGLQMGTARTSDAEQVSNLPKAIGFDAYNQTPTGGVSKAMTTKGDSDHIPIVFVLNRQDKKSMSVTENKTNALLQDPKQEPVVYTMKIRGGRSVDSKGHSAGKGPLIQTNLSATLGVAQDQYLFQPSRGGYWCIGNGQVHQTYLQEKVGALNCLVDQQKVLIPKK